MWTIGCTGFFYFFTHTEFTFLATYHTNNFSECDQSDEIHSFGTAAGAPFHNIVADRHSSQYHATKSLLCLSCAELGWQTVAFTTSQHLCRSWSFSEMAGCLMASSKHHLMSRIRAHVYNTSTASHCSAYLHDFGNLRTFPHRAFATCCVSTLQHLPSTAEDESPTIFQG